MKIIKNLSIALGLAAIISVPALANAQSHHKQHGHKSAPHKVVKVAPKRHNMKHVRHHYKRPVHYKHRPYPVKRVKYVKQKRYMERHHRHKRPLFVFRIS